MDWVEKQNLPLHRHPWELSRTDSLLRILKEFPGDRVYADVGAGDLFFAERLSQVSGQTVVAVDPAFPDMDPAGPIRCFRRLEDVPSESVDGVLLLDVLEHVADDAAFFRSAMRLLKAGGRVIVTVPAHPFLFPRMTFFSGITAATKETHSLPFCSRRLLSSRNVSIFIRVFFWREASRKWQVWRFERPPNRREWGDGLMRKRIPLRV